MVRKIMDEFAGLEKAWQRSQARRNKKGLCGNCSCQNPRPEGAFYCPPCAEKNRLKANTWYAKKKGEADVKSNG